MTTSITRAPKRNHILVKDKEHGVLPFAHWCKRVGMKHGTLLLRVWRAGLTTSSDGIVTLDADGEHEALLRKPVQERSHG